ncbi:serine/threonine-protein kinase drkD isoform X3 [Biomphalaria pfeifferi]|uniref:Serine/threonine-protein kinase drkD isoform X3 n=1 Tax=Biomphalaria pfeifferi TaxID=112525 RepID=A0AAD8B3L7_BIOPF|nr:serine/threonine-protein kinase drkD isoform X3 [Biomphalaria pfeifferi]
MSLEVRSSDRRRYINELQAREKEIAAGLLKASQSSSPKAVQDNEKRMRREIANSNERRRMQCINAGFSSLRTLMPQLEGEKLSKAAILQHTIEYITSLEQDKIKLQAQLDHTRRLLTELGQDRVMAEPYMTSTPPPTKRKKRDTESSDEGVGMMSDGSDEGGSELQHENVSLRHQLETQKQQCATLTERNRLLEAQVLSLLNIQATHPSTNELHSVNFDSHQFQNAGLYSRELSVIASRESFVSSPVDMYQPPRPMSPTPEQDMSVDPTFKVENTSSGYFPVSSPQCIVSQKDEPVSYVLKVEAAHLEESSNSIPVPSSLPSARVTTLTSSSTQQQHNSHHNYCHRDHPRRRLRQLAQLDQQKSENFIQLQEQESLTVPNYRPKHNTQNLENLVEAIRQIEGDRILCDDKKFNDSDKQKHKKPRTLSDSEECVSTIDQEEPKSTNSNHDTPSYEPDIQADSLLYQQQISTLSTASSFPISSIKYSNASSASEKYPIATQLLHRPVHQSYYRSGVIVQKP